MVRETGTALEPRDASGAGDALRCSDSSAHDWASAPVVGQAFSFCLPASLTPHMPVAVQSDNVAGLFVPLELEHGLLFTFLSLVSRHMQFLAGRFV